MVRCGVDSFAICARFCFGCVCFARHLTNSKKAPPPAPTAKKAPPCSNSKREHTRTPTAKNKTPTAKKRCRCWNGFSTVSAGRCFVFAVWARTGRSLTCWFAGASAAEHNGKKPPTAQKPKRLFWKPSLVRHCLLCYSSGCVPCFKVFVQLAEWKRKSQVSSLAHGSQNNARIS